MRFTHLYAENWRNFRRVNVALEQRVFIVGPNASGKSNLLDIFRFLRDIAEPGGGLRRAVERPPDSLLRRAAQGCGRRARGPCPEPVEGPGRPEADTVALPAASARIQASRAGALGSHHAGARVVSPWRPSARPVHGTREPSSCRSRLGLPPKFRGVPGWWQVVSGPSAVRVQRVGRARAVVRAARPRPRRAMCASSGRPAGSCTQAQHGPAGRGARRGGVNARRRRMHRRAAGCAAGESAARARGVFVVSFAPGRECPSGRRQAVAAVGRRRVPRLAPS